MRILSNIESLDMIQDGNVRKLSDKEDVNNKVTSISSSSTDTQYPSAKAVYDALASSGGSGKITWTATLNTTWTGASAPYTKTVSLTDMLSTYVPELDIIYSSNTATAITEKEEFAKIDKIESNNGSVTLTCFTDKPTISLNVRIETIVNGIINGNGVSY